MLFLNTIDWQKELQDSPEKLQRSLSIKSSLQQIAEAMDIEDLLERGREILFNFYMEEEEYTFSASSISRVFDYRQNLDQNEPELGKSETGRNYLDLLFTIDKLWQYTQAPVSELVKAGKYQLTKVNGAASYANFRENTEKMPELFAETKALVDSYLNVEVLVSLIDITIARKEEIDSQILNRAIEELRAFAGRGLKFGFWTQDSNVHIPILDELDVDSYVLPH